MLQGKSKTKQAIVENVVVEEKSHKITLPVTLKASEEVDIKMQQEGTIDRMLVNKGESIEVGQPLFRLAEDEIRIKLAQLRSEQKDAQETLEKNSYYQKNKDRLFEEGRIDRATYDNLDSEVTSNETKVEKMGQSITELEDVLTNSAVISEVNGIVTKIEANTGLVISKGQIVLKVSKIDPIIASFNVHADEGSFLKQGMEIGIMVTAYTGRPFPAKITKIDDKPDSLEVIASLENPNNLLEPGMTGSAEFTTGKKERLFIIPQSAVFKEKRNHYVFKVVDGIARKVPVIRGNNRENSVEIVGGLNDEDIVVVSGQEELKDGDAVDIWGK